MNGLAEPQAPQQSNSNFEGEGDDEIGAGLTEEQASPEEQKMYDAIVEPMLGIVHGEKSSGKIVESLKGGMTIAELTFQIGSVVVGEIEKQGRSVPPEILQMAAEDVVEDLVEIAVSIGLVKDDEAEIEKAYIDGLMGAVDMYGEGKRKSGQITAEGGAAHIDEMTALGGFDKTKTSQAVNQATQGV